jgi:phage repressor protein C with HTH and peptisase S24 domain
VTPPVGYQSWQNWERGKGLSYIRLQQIAQVLGVSIREMELHREQASDAKVVTFPVTHRSMTFDSKVPVFGLAAGAGERIAFSEGQETRYVSVHPNQIGHKDAGAAEVIGESMIPRYRPQEIVFFVRNRHPVRGSDVVLELSDGTALIKEYDGQRQGQVWVREYCPEERLYGLPADQVSRHTPATSPTLARGGGR